MENQTYMTSIGLYLIALALLQQNGVTYTNREIEQALKAMQYELGLN